MIIKFINATIITMNESDEIIKNGEVIVKDNIISYVGASNNAVKGDKVIDLKGKILMPGFINTHCHSAMSLMRGLGGNAVFEQWWQENMVPIEEQLTYDDIYNGTLLSAYEMIRAGITSAVDLYINSEAAAEALADAKMRAWVNIGARCVNLQYVDIEDLEEEYKDMLNLSPLIKPIKYAHAVYSCSDEIYSGFIDFANKHNLVFTTHASETLAEVGKNHTQTGLTPIALLEKYGAFDMKCLLAHCVHLDKDDINILKQYEGVSVSTNASSNLYLGSGIAPIYSYLKNGINVCLGTDGPASNNSLNMFKEMYLVKNLQSGIMNDASLVTSLEVLKMATINGAKALNMDNLGAIKKGYLADLIVIDNTKPNMQPEHDVVCNIVNSCSVENVVLTMIDGKILYENGEYYLDNNLSDILKNTANYVSKFKKILNDNK